MDEWSLWSVLFLGSFGGSVRLRASARVLVDLRESSLDFLGKSVLFRFSRLGLLVGVWSRLSWTGEEEEEK